jgi:hypothetical protein
VYLVYWEDDVKQCAYCQVKMSEEDLRSLGKNDALDVIVHDEAVVCIDPDACIKRIERLFADLGEVPPRDGG